MTQSVSSAEGSGIWTRAVQLITAGLAAVAALPIRPASAAGVPFNHGDVFAGVGQGVIKHFSPTGTLLDTLNTGDNSLEDTGMAFDANGNLFASDFQANHVVKFGTTGNLIGQFGSGFTGNNPESITIDGSGNVYVGQADGTTQVLKFNSSGSSLASFSPAREDRGTDWVDLAPDQCTLYYTSEGQHIKRFNVCSNTQMADFATLPSTTFALRIRPNGEILVAGSSAAYRLSSSGTVLQTYPLPTGETSFLFALNLDPDGTSFWTAGYASGHVYKIDIASGAIETQFNAGITVTLAGLAVFGEVTPGAPSQPAPGAAPTFPPGLPGTGGSADPVNTLTGSFGYSHTDLAIAGRSPSPVLTRTYNSADARGPISGVPWISPLGPGWTHNYATHLASPGDGSSDLLLVGPQGRTDRYTALGGGTFAPPSGVATALLANPDGSYVATLADQTKWTFDQRGRLIRIADRYDSTSTPSAATLTYNSTGQLATVSDPAGRGSLTFGYDPTSGLLTSVSDWTGRVVRYTYDGGGRLATVQDRVNDTSHRTVFAYDGTSQHLTGITDANGHTAVSMTYDNQGRVLHQWDALGTDQTLHRTEFTYDSSAACLTPTAPNPPVCATTVTYPATSLEPTFGPQQLDTYTNNQLTSRVLKPSSFETLTETRAYDSGTGFLTQTTDPRGNTTTFCYDTGYNGSSAGSRGNLTRVITPAPGGAGGSNPLVTLVKFDTKNNVVETISPKGVANGPSVTCATNLSGAVNSNKLYTTDLGYDTTQGTELVCVARYVTIGSVQPVTTRLQYTDPGNPGAITYVIPPRGNAGTDCATTNPSPDMSYATHLVYNGSGAQAGQLQSVTDALGNQTTYSYDNAGRRTALTDPLHNTWSFQYDNEDRQTQATAPGVLVTSAQFDSVGNRIALTDANGQITRYSYDARDSLQQVLQSDTNTDPSASGANKITAQYSYDLLGNMIRVDRAGAGSSSANFEEVVDYAYDGLNRVRRETQYPQGVGGQTTPAPCWPQSPNGSTSGCTENAALVTTTTYDANSNRSTLLDPLGHTTTFAHDAINRLVGITYSDGQTANVSYAYDGNGNRTTMLDGTGTTSYSYDELDRLLGVTTPGSQTVRYQFDPDGNRTQITYPDNTSVNYTFNKASQLTSMQDWASRTTSYTYYADGLLNTQTNVNGTIATFSYDAARRMTELSNTLGANTISRHSYQLDPVGNRTQVAEYLPQIGPPQPLPNTTFAWGSNHNGQIGNGSFYNELSPVQVSGLGSVGAVAEAGGFGHSLAIKPDQSVWAWGKNIDGQLGNNSTNVSLTPVQVSGLSNVIAVAAGKNHSLALKSDGTVWAWGSNRNGQLGVTPASTCADFDGVTISCSLVPVQIAGLTNVAAIAAGSDHSLAVKSDGSVWTWGLNDQGQLGVSTSNSCTNLACSPTPVQITSLSGVHDVSGGQSHSLARKTDGTVWAWGSNTYGQLGNNSTVNSTTPVQVTGVGTTANAISAGQSHNLVLKNDGTVWSWGLNTSGQLGVTSGTTCSSSPCSLVPVQVAGLTNVVVIAAGANHSLVARSDSSVWDWGENDDGELGNGTTTSHTAPAQVGGLTGAVVLAGGADHSLAATRASAATTTYSYDNLYRLKTATTASGTTSYSYDPTGNRLTKTLGGSTTSYTYDRADRILSAGSMTYSVNPNGNETARGSDGFTYDQANRLISALVGGAASTYIYDGDGKRISKTVTGTTSYVYDVASRLPVLLDDGTQKYVWGAGGLAYSVNKTSNSVGVYHTDGLGSVRAISDGAANITQTFQTDEFGIPTLSQGTNTQPFGFTGEHRDAEDGLLYLRSRLYDPISGRFMQRDQVGGLTGNSCTLNRYVYANDNPIGLRDPSGLLTCSILASVGAAGAGWNGQIAFGIAQDSQGNAALVPTYLLGGGTAIGLSTGITVLITRDESVFGLDEPGLDVGASVTPIDLGLAGIGAGADVNLDRSGRVTGGSIGIVGGIGPKIPVELHAGVTGTTLGGTRIIDPRLFAVFRAGLALASPPGSNALTNAAAALRFGLDACAYLVSLAAEPAPPGKPDVLR